MSIPPGPCCDGPRCGAIKRETNHWFVTIENSAGFSVQPVELFDRDAYDDTVSLNDICGEACGVKRLQVWFTTQKENNATTE